MAPAAPVVPPAPPTIGPAEAALGALLQTLTAGGTSNGAPASGDGGNGHHALHIELSSRRSKADVCIRLPGDPDAGAGTDTASDAGGDEATKRLVDDLVAMPAVEWTEAFPPRLFVRLTLPFLYDSVLSGIEEAGDGYGCLPAGTREPVLVTFTDPNTNKPLHVGHLRNLFLGSALAALHEARGHAVRREGTMGDWGVHMCQAVLGYLDAGGGPDAGVHLDPGTAGTKPDHFVGRFYTGYHAGAAGGGDDRRAHELLLELEAGDDLLTLHRRLAEWASAGIQATYERVGLRLDAVHRESDHLGDARRLLDDGLRHGVLRMRDDGSVVFDDDEAEAEVPLVRSDGTLLVLAQILGIDGVRFAGWEHPILSVFGHQWEAAATSYRRLASALGHRWAQRYEPLFYAMVELPSGAMRSREGRAVTADQAVDEVAAALDRHLAARGSHRPPTGFDAEGLAVAVLKYHLLRKPRTKTLRFDAEQVATDSARAFARLASWAGLLPTGEPPASTGTDGERQRGGEPPLRQVLLSLSRFPFDLQRAVDRRDPAIVVRFLDDLVEHCERLDAESRSNPRLIAAVAQVARIGLRAVDIVPAAASDPERRTTCLSTT